MPLPPRPAIIAPAPFVLRLSSFVSPPERPIKKSPTSQKLRGAYYTPAPLAAFLARWAIRAPSATVLEPSCGDGALLEAAVAALRERGATPAQVARQVRGIELEAPEAAKARARLSALGIPEQPGQIHQGDFFGYCRDHILEERLLGTLLAAGHPVDAVIGNPPFIRYQSFPEAQRVVAFELMQRAGLHPNRLTNAWVPFLVAATLALKEGGRLAMVIPAELLQVSYPAEVRQFLADAYREVVLVTFRDLVFEEIQQEVILLLGEQGSGSQHQIRVLEVDGAASLPHPDAPSPNGHKPLLHSAEKWTLYFLSGEEVALLRRLRDHPLLTWSGQVMEVNVGVVTGQNDFFLLTGPQANEAALRDYSLPVVSRSAHLPGACFTRADWEANGTNNLPTYLFYPPNAAPADLDPAVQRYIAQGEAAGVHRGYKCRIRPRWYRVPTTWVPDAFMLRQVHRYPKLILNESGATCTDTIHRVRFLPGVDGRTVTAAFLNSLTFAFAEITGRSYGGGVLTFEPSEARSLPLPLVGAASLDLPTLDAALRANDLDAVLARTDQVLLQEGLGLSPEEVRMVRGIWEKLRDRRIYRKHRRAGEQETDG